MTSIACGRGQQDTSLLARQTATICTDRCKSASVNDSGVPSFSLFIERDDVDDLKSVLAVSNCLNVSLHSSSSRHGVHIILVESVICTLRTLVYHHSWLLLFLEDIYVSFYSILQLIRSILSFWRKDGNLMLSELVVVERRPKVLSDRV